MAGGRGNKVIPLRMEIPKSFLTAKGLAAGLLSPDFLSVSHSRAVTRRAPVVSDRGKVTFAERTPVKHFSVATPT